MIIIDRIEGEIAIVEYEDKFYNIPWAWLPAGTKEGDMLSLTLEVDKEATAKRREEMKRKVDDLFSSPHW